MGGGGDPQQAATVRMRRVLKKGRHWRRFHHLARIDHRDRLAIMRDDAEIAGHQQQRGAGVSDQTAHQIEDLARYRDVEPGRRLVSDQQPWRMGQRHRDDDALAHAAAHLVWVREYAFLRGRDPHCAQKLHRLATGGAPIDALMRPQHVDDLLSNAEQWVEVLSRLRGRQRDFGPPDRVHLRLGLGSEVLTVERHGACANPPWVLEQSEDRAQQDRLARSGFADDADRLAGLDSQVHSIEHADRARVGLEVDLESTDVQQGRHGLQRLFTGSR